MRFINIVPIFPGNIDHMVSEALRMRDDLGITEVALCMTLHRQQGDCFEKIMLHKKVLHDYKALLVGSGIKVGVLFQSLLGHRNDALNDEPWQFADNFNKVKVTRACILDPGFRDYIYQVVKLITEELPEQLMVDDDCRQVDGQGFECFCPAHMAQFNMISPRLFEADELREHLASAPDDDEIVQLVYRLCRENLVDFAKLVRSAIDAVDENIPCACCTPGSEFLIIGDFARALAGKNRPMIRLCNANYGEITAKDFPLITYKTYALRNLISHPEEIDIIDEADTYPHHRYSKSARALHAKLAFAIINGEIGAKLWITNLSVMDTYTQRKYDDVFKKFKTFYPALLEIVKGAVDLGPITPLPAPAEISRIYNPVTQNQPFYTNDWQFNALNHYGIPGMYRRISGGNGPYMIRRGMIRYFSNSEVKELLSHNCLVDFDSTLELMKRGFGSELGVKLTPCDLCLNDEIHQDGRNFSYFQSETKNVLQPIEGAEVVTQLICRPYAKAEHYTVAGCGLTFFRNSLGGLIAVTGSAGWLDCHPLRRELLIEILERLNGGPLCVICESDQDVFLRAQRLTDGLLMATVCNLNFDELESVILKVMTMPTKVEYLDHTGLWMPIQYKVVDGGIEISHKLEIYEFVILRLS